MNKTDTLYIFGEVLFDCFQSGEEVLGGAPFNVAWHLQAMGDGPKFISRVGKDVQGERIFKAMSDWQMDLSWMQRDDKQPTGRVDVRLIDNEPHYDIVQHSAYDFISEELPEISGGILYHGSLCLRSEVSRSTFQKIAGKKDLDIFFDVNLRSPWWKKEDVLGWLKNVRWAKMNEGELQLLSEDSRADTGKQMAHLQKSCGLEQLIVTRGGDGVIVRIENGKLYFLSPEPLKNFVDTVGAGDAFSAVYLHGLSAGWPVDTILEYAQRFAGKIIGLRGAVSSEKRFYRDVTNSFPS